MSRFDYRFGKDFDKEKIIHSVSKYGIAVIEDFLEPKELEQLKNESEILLKKLFVFQKQRFILEKF